jgi:hypothetical protein
MIFEWDGFTISPGLAQLLASEGTRDRVYGKSAPMARVQTGQSGRIVGQSLR